MDDFSTTNDNTITYMDTTPSVICDNLKMICDEEITPNYDYEKYQPSSPINNYEPSSPTYEPSSLPNYEPTSNNLCETNSITHINISKSFIENVKPCKRLYGEEYNIVDKLITTPQAKKQKFSQPEFTLVSSQANDTPLINVTSTTTITSAASTDTAVTKTTSSTTQTFCGVPTKTNRSFSLLKIKNLSDIPDICYTCYSINCFCNLFDTK